MDPREIERSISQLRKLLELPNIANALHGPFRSDLEKGYDTAAPTTGTWRVGDKVWNQSPTPGGYIGWVCTTEGTPGTWRGFGLIQS